ASEIRRHLASETAAGHQRAHRAELSGLVDAVGATDHSGVTLHTRSAAVARSMVRLWKAEFGLEPRLFPVEPDSFGRARYAVRVEGPRVVGSMKELEGARGSRSMVDRTAYLRGAFQGVGSVTRPGRDLHLEFVHRDEGFVRRIVEFSRASLKISHRRGRWVAYTKSADGVTTLLSQMGLNEAVLEYEARFVLGEAKANANRVTNFDSANAGRTALAAARQQDALKRLDPEELPLALREMLDLRLEYPDASLTELARLGEISKSAANHRLRRLVELAEKQPGSC
ncbi:MAG: DNA-binding protein WhiA, partial [Rubrobacteraceae bacterium]